MAHQSARNVTPEAQELKRKQLELSQLEIELTDRELELTTLLAELAALERRYLDVVGRRYAKLDRIEAKIAEELSRRSPADASAQIKEGSVRQKSNESPASSGESFEIPPIHGPIDFKPSDELQRLYRQAARTLHPDLAAVPAERERRRRFMTELNDAYQKGDEPRIQQLLREWHASPENVEGEGTAADLVRTIRKIAQVRERLVVIDRELKLTRQVELSQLRTQVDEAASEGRDLIQEMAERVDDDIASAQRRWSQLFEGESQ